MPIRRGHVPRESLQRLFLDFDDLFPILENGQRFCDSDGLWLSTLFRARDYQWKLSRDTNDTGEHKH